MFLNGLDEKLNIVMIIFIIVVIIILIIILILVQDFPLDIRIKDLNNMVLKHEKIKYVGYIYSNLTFFKTKLISHRDIYIQTENGDKYAILSYTDYNTMKNENEKLNSFSIVNYVKICKFPFYSKWYYEFGRLKKVNKLFYLDNIYEIYKNILKHKYNIINSNCQHRCRVLVNMMTK